MILKTVSSLQHSFEIFPTAESDQKRAKAVNSVLPEVSISGKYTTANLESLLESFAPSTNTDDRGTVLMEVNH